MSARALTSNVDRSAQLDTDDRFAPDFFYSGERICPPADRSRGNVVLQVYVALFLVLGIGWATVGPKPQWLSALIERMSALVPSSLADDSGALPEAAMPAVARSVATTAAAPMSSAADPKQASSPQVPGSQMLGASAVAGPADQMARSELPPTTEVASPPPIVEAPTEAAAQPTDPYQRRAAAVGLNPDLSRVLLGRLSPVDYRNAGVAIETAVAKTPDAGEFVWPRKLKPGLALFKVHFVQGAAPGCRRYVVTVTKDGWTTTAPPLEKCGSTLAQGRSEEPSR